MTIQGKHGTAPNLDLQYTAIDKVGYTFLDRRRVGLIPIFGVSAVLMKGQSHWLVVESGGAQRKQLVLRLDKSEFRVVIAALNSRSGKRVEVLDDSSNPVDPTIGSRDEDETVPVQIDRVADALKFSMERYGCKIGKSRQDRIECRRGLRPQGGVGGGESIIALLQATGQETHVQIQTRAGLGRNWSTPILHEMRSRLASTP